LTVVLGRAGDQIQVSDQPQDCRNDLTIPSGLLALADEVIE
jgi:hypothetical protein